MVRGGVWAGTGALEVGRRWAVAGGADASGGKGEKRGRRRLKLKKRILGVPHRKRRGPIGEGSLEKEFGEKKNSCAFTFFKKSLSEKGSIFTLKLFPILCFPPLQ